ncbi:TIGR03667 family PPOX class F420-dependent oxidoreductase [Phytoactinopolyspora halotolerans]|uniref:TIGR03667 family PPOX class F420-dependent oxidoreductase n=1 Tax=Phytoactinopolyspora halotolerans TaxID=1981512 RepID=A0A6L9S6X1_9ACTN|nr:TIGR03667 family PPOX class F420-dependent oxidoreductase [Phytoactinopolyspora halotolerans]NEE00757.1 TIGR03667 family PPOX class F420-dependent oxidoreductase [Phytoactinopolyspora halotolerans]
MTTEDVLPSPETPFGERVRTRLKAEQVIWLTTVSKDGTPQPNPVWFLWTGDDEIIAYSDHKAHRLAHIEAHPQVSLHFNGTSTGGDIIVMTGRAELADDLPAPDASPQYLAKYREDMISVVGSVEQFAATYSAPIRIRITRVRGF